MLWLAIDRTPDDRGDWRQGLRDAGWSPDLVSMLTRGLAHRPKDRHQTIEDWNAALERALRPRSTPLPTGPADADGTGPWPDDRPHRLTLALQVLATLVLGVGLGAAGDAAIPDRGGPTVRTEQGADGSERTIVENHRITITLDGPTTLTVDQPAHFTATVDGAKSWAWVGPDGLLIAATNDTDELELEAQSPGHTNIQILATDEHGQTVKANRQLNVINDSEA